MKHQRLYDFAWNALLVAIPVTGAIVICAGIPLLVLLIARLLGVE